MQARGEVAKGGEGERRERRGAKGSKGGKGGEVSEGVSTLGFRVPTTSVSGEG